MLHELIDMGMGFARTVHQQGTAQAGPESPDGDPAAAAVQTAAAFDRISRAVRRTIALARKVAEPLPARVDAGQRRAAARRRILREVEDAIQREADGAEEEALEAELRERLDGSELEDEIEGRPVGEVVAEICRDLGLGTLLGNHPWKRRTPPDIAALCARAAQPAGGQPGAGQPSAGPALPSVAYYVPDRPKPPPYTEAGAIELMHKLLELRPPRIRGP